MCGKIILSLEKDVIIKSIKAVWERVMEQIIEILLVEDDKNMCDIFKFAIERNKKFHLAAQTGKQHEGLELLRNGKMGAVILDLELDEGDGIDFLDEIKNLDIEKPLIVVITNSRSEITIDCIHAKGVEFVCQKCNESYSPDMVLNIIEQTYPFRRKKNSPQMDVISYQQSQKKMYQRKRIEEELSCLGFRRNIRATGYLLDAIHYMVFEKDGEDCGMKEVYSVVAKINNTRDVNVEKAIRDNIERTWNKTSPEILERYYPYPTSKGSGTPTNMEFIKNIARKIGKV